MQQKNTSFFRRIFYSKRSRLSFILLLFAIVPTLISSSLLLILRENEIHVVRDSLSGYLVYFGLATLAMAFAITPTTFVAILSGFFFQWNGLPGVLVSYLGAIIIGMLLGEKISTWFVGGFIADDEKLKDFFARLKERTFLMIIIGRLSPHLPFAMMNVAFASMQVPWVSYLVGSFIGMLPRTLLSFYLGMNVKEIYSFAKNPREDEWMNIATIALIVVSTAGIIWLVKNALHRKSVK